MQIMADVIGGGVNELVDAFVGTSEELVTYLLRLTQIKPTIATFEFLGYSLGETEAQAMKAALALEDAAGGQQNLVNALGSYYQNFYSEEEKVQKTTEQLTKAFADLGLGLPKTTAEFRSLMDEAVGSGNTGLIASLLSMQQTFFDLTNASTEATEAMGTLLEEINRLRGVNVSDPAASAGLQAEFATLTAMARAGDLSAIAKLPGVSQAIEADMQGFAASASDVIFARAWLAQSLEDTMAVLNGTATSDQVMNTAGTVGSVGATLTAGTTGATLASTSMTQADLITSLITEIQMLRAEVRADVDANSKSARILDRAMQDGESLNVTVLA
jgi:hypothetical protein